MTHPAGTDQRRVRKRLPSDFDFDTFIRQLDNHRNRFNLKVCDGDRQVYGLDLEMCFQYMSRVREGMLPRDEPVADFVAFLHKDAAHADPKTEDWMRMLTNASFGPRENVVVCGLIAPCIPFLANISVGLLPRHCQNVGACIAVRHLAKR